MEGFCGSEFWNQNRTWETQDPDLTPCFESTVLVWSPCLFLWFCSVGDAYKFGASKKLSRPGHHLRWTPRAVSKVVLSLVLILLVIAKFVLGDTNAVSIKWINVAVETSTILLFIAIVVVHRCQGVHTSGSHFVFWTFSLLFKLITLRTTAKHYQNTENGGLSVVIESVQASIILIQLLIHFWSDHSFSEHTLLEETNTIKEPSPELRASFVSQTLFSWATPLAILGYQKPLENDDLWLLAKRHRSQQVSTAYCKKWNRPKPLHAKHKCTVWRNIIVPLWGVIGTDFLKAQLCYLGSIVAGFLFPQIMSLLITFVENPLEEAWKGFLFAFLMLVVSIFRCISLNYGYYLQAITWLNAQAALTPILYRKTLNISYIAKTEFTAGTLNNLLTVDVNRVREIFWLADLPWSGPLQLGSALYFLYLELGVYAFVGLGVLILLIPVNWVLMRSINKLQVIQMKTKDERMNLMNEVLSGIKVLKYFAWEPSFEEQLKEVRSREVRNIRSQSYLNSLVELVFQSSPFLVALTTFAAYTTIDPSNVLDSRKVFVSLALFNLLKIPINEFPRFVSALAKSAISYKRINDFLNAEENNPEAINWLPKTPKQNEFANNAVSISRGHFTWTENGDPTLTDINISIKRGQLVAVVGSVASGKSSLISAIIGEMRRVKGSVSVLDSIAYVPQIAWIQNATLRDNILFGAPYLEYKYNNVLECCALMPDLAILPGGDATEIGEKGINLSGGQKQRVALARAAYQDAELFLLDDPLSAVDVHVAQHLFENLLGPQGILGSKTRIMVTHSVTYLSRMDSIIVMKDGSIKEVGTYEQLRENGGAFSEFFAQHDTQSETNSETKAIDMDSKNENKEKAGSKLIEAESVNLGQVKFHVYVDYFRAVGWVAVALIVAFFVIAQGLGVCTNIWLSVWVSKTKNASDALSNVFFLGVYTALGVSQCLMLLGGALCVYIGSIYASQKLHNQMLSRILHAPMTFFDTTPLGRIINRFGEDIDAMDNRICWDFEGWLSAFFQFVGIIATVSFALPEFLGVVVPAAVIYYFILRFYASTTRQLNRLITVLRSPIFSQLGETLATNGIPSIGAFKVKEQFITRFEEKLDSLMAAWYAVVATRRWMAIRLESLAGVLVFAASLVAVLSRSVLSGGLVGLAISYALQVTDTLSWLTKITSFLEPDMVCVERVLDYAMSVEQEAEFEVVENKPPKNWPQDGSIQFENVNLRYRDGLDLVLRDVSFQITPGEKVGVVGRTGAGKSSLTTALFRIVELAQEGGAIKIDAVDLAQLGLHDVRRNLTIIPQDPVLFSASIRVNLDPFNEYADAEMWSALEHANLKEYVDTLSEGLEYKLSAGGENLSVGQRQLLCIARAILRKPKILVLDEATAAIDLDTDQLIQKTIRREFKDCTVLTIAHRIHTIMDSSRILVLDNGQVKEFDTPANLLANTESIFRALALGAGLNVKGSSANLITLN